jgi:hypothetical protein
MKQAQPQLSKWWKTPSCKAAFRRAKQARKQRTKERKAEKERLAKMGSFAAQLMGVTR